MKHISLKRSITSVSSFAVFLLLLGTAVLSCKKDELVKFSTDLAINSKIVRVADSAGKTRIQVYADNDWSLTTDGDASWISFDKEKGNGKDEFIVSFTSNKGKLPRSVNITIKGGGEENTISFQQKGLTPTLKFTDRNANGIGNGGQMKTGITTNVPFALIKSESIGGEWVTGLELKGNYLYFNLSPNSTPIIRNTTLKLSYLDALGATVKDSILISQNPKPDNDNAVLKSFDYVKASLAAGTITEDIYIEGIIVSDKGNPNMGLNANKATNKHEVDKTENAITVYIQSMDGRSGIHIRTKTGGDNIFGKDDVVKLWLKGTKLRKETNPSRAILEDVQSMNVISKTEGPAVAPREVHMRDLTDNDLYTYVTLKDVEISVPSGSFFNINEGYYLRTDAFPINIRDIDGNSMYMITNIDVPYRRDGKRVPQGSGNITGVLVNENLSRYGGDIGKYSIRHFKRSDIDLKENREDGFSKILVEWDRFIIENNTGITADKNPLTPSIGAGILSHSDLTALNFTSTGISAATDWNGLLQENTTIKGAISNGAWAAKSWWNTAKNRGAWWKIEVSTVGISKPISLQLEGGGDIGGPRNWAVEWSTTGDEAGTWNKVAEYTLQDIVDWTSTLLTQSPGYKVLNFKFPNETLGLTKLYIRLRVVNNVVGKATSDTGATLTTTAVSRLGHLSIKYNK